METTFFPTATDMRMWLAEHHAAESELWVGFYKKASGRPSITWQESVVEALCFGWIDGVRKSTDAHRFKIRFTPRKKASIWSAVNIKLATGLQLEGRLHPAGLKAFEARRENRSVIYSYEQRSVELPHAYSQILKQNPIAEKFFIAQPPSYRQKLCWSIVSAKTEGTRLKRLARLIEACVAGMRI